MIWNLRRIPRDGLAIPRTAASFLCIVQAVLNSLTVRVVGSALCFGLALGFLTACSGDPTPTPNTGDEAAPPLPSATEALTPVPALIASPTPVPTVIPLSLDLPQNPTPRPTATIDPNAPTPTPSPTPGPSWGDLEPDEVEGILCQTLGSGGVTEDQIPANLYPFHRSEHVAAPLRDGRIIMGGGFITYDFLPHPTIDVYDPALDSWCSVFVPDDWTWTFERLSLNDGSVLMIDLTTSDQSDGEPMSKALLFDAETLSFSTMAPPAVRSAIAQLALLDDGRVLRVGGLLFDFDEDPNAVVTSTGVEIYDPATDSWTPASSLKPEPALTLADISDLSPPQWLLPMTGGRVMFVRSGKIGDERRQGLVEIYNVATDSWRMETEFDAGFGVWHVTMTSTDTLYVFTATLVEIYDPNTDQWTFAYNPRGIPTHSTVTELPDGRLLVAGGYADGLSYNPNPTARTEIFDPTTMTWAAGPELAEPRRHHTATLMPDGSVLLFGGIGLVIDRDQLTPLNTLDLIPAESLAEVDTATRP